ncbi:MAG TPA: hypothetical protein VLY23_16560, partial [Candidatus Acidoferrum sp.]|nr:hypothetical protein [Candidatus Acidoferrum sp.]
SLSTMHRKSGILMNVHSTSREDLIAQHNQHLPFRSNGQPVERSQLAGIQDAESREVQEYAGRAVTFDHC